MKNQSSFDKVNTVIIQPLGVLFHYRLDEQFTDWLVESLEDFSKEILVNAFKEIRNTCKKMPSIAAIIEVCKKMQEKSYTPNATNKPRINNCHVYGSAKAENVFPDDVAEILATPEGKLAMDLGVAGSLMVFYERTAQKVFTEEFVRRQHKFLLEAVENIGKFPASNASLQAMCLKLYNTMLDREKNLRERFSSPT